MRHLPAAVILTVALPGTALAQSGPLTIVIADAGRVITSSRNFARSE